MEWRKYWFTLGLLIVVLITMADGSGTVAGAGRWFRSHRGAEAAVFIIFLASGLDLDMGRLRRGLSDWRTLCASLLVIFVFAPLLARVFATLPLSAGMRIGLCLVAVMPTTLSSGVVMTTTAGGETATALAVTVSANSLAIFTIPLVLPLLLGPCGHRAGAVVDKALLMLRIAIIVLLPLLAGLALRAHWRGDIERSGLRLSLLNQCLILFIVWMAASASRTTIMTNASSLATAVVLSFVYHGLLLAGAFATARLAGIGRGRRETLIFMGAQKTLALSILLQMTLFPGQGEALVFCVSHHLVHLLMDGYLVGRLAPSDPLGRIP